MKNTLCYGVSNMWGFIPGVPKRYPADIRWIGVGRNCWVQSTRSLLTVLTAEPPSGMILPTSAAMTLLDWDKASTVQNL